MAGFAAAWWYPDTPENHLPLPLQRHLWVHPRCSKQSRFRRRALPILPPSPLPATAHLQPLAQPTALRHPGSRCDIDSHPDCRPILILIVAPQPPPARSPRAVQPPYGDGSPGRNGRTPYRSPAVTLSHIEFQLIRHLHPGVYGSLVDHLVAPRRVDPAHDLVLAGQGDAYRITEAPRGPYIHDASANSANVYLWSVTLASNTKFVITRISLSVHTGPSWNSMSMSSPASMRTMASASVGGSPVPASPDRASARWAPRPCGAPADPLGRVRPPLPC